MIKLLSSNIYGAKRGKAELDDVVPQAAVALASFCRQHK